jgi:signal transduction histidine kinase
LLATGINDYGRSRLYFKDNERGFMLSIIGSMSLLGGISILAPNGDIAIYTLLLVIEIFLFARTIPRGLLLFHFVVFITPFTFHPSLRIIGNAAINYGSYVLVGMLFRSIVSEKLKTEQLYAELEGANLKLEEYARHIEELAIARERTRIAQELHDSMGHSLVALSMNLEYAAYAVDNSPARTKEVIMKAQAISQEGMAHLREAVSMLQEPGSAWSLRRSLLEVFANFERTGELRFDLRMDEEMEEEEPAVKSCLYKSVREAITNGIRHGQATAFTVDIGRGEQEIVLRISNNGNGAGRGPLLKSDGLQGMERRVDALGGELHIQTDAEEGFALEIRIPGAVAREPELLFPGGEGAAE